MLLDASLDTSFWNIASQIGVVPYLFDFFRVYYCETVKYEIITTGPGKTTLIYPQAKLFMMIEKDGHLQPQEPQRPLTRFGAGEANAMALALEKNWVLLINDSRPCTFAQMLGIHCVTVPAFCALLYDKGQITYSGVRGYLTRLESTTNSILIAEATQAVVYIAQQRGEDL